MYKYNKFKVKNTDLAKQMLADANEDTFFFLKKENVGDRWQVLKKVHKDYFYNINENENKIIFFHLANDFVEVVLEGYDLPIAEKLLKQFYYAHNKNSLFIINGDGVVGTFLDDDRKELFFNDGSMYAVFNIDDMLKEKIILNS